MNRALGWGDRPRRAERAAGSQAPRSNDVARVHLSIEQCDRAFVRLGLCETGRTARRCHEASVIRSMSGNGSVRKKVDLIWSVVSPSGDSALECDLECVQGWFRALCLSNTSRTPPRSGLSDERKGSTRHLGVRRDRLGWFTPTRPPGARRRGRLAGTPISLREPTACGARTELTSAPSFQLYSRSSDPKHVTITP